MSTTSRGNQAQDDAKTQLEQEGNLVEMAKPSVRVRWSREKNDYVHEPKHDFFGLVDLIALRPNKVRLVQVTHPSGVSERVAKIRNRVAPELLASQVLSWEVWEKQRDGFRVHLVGASA